MYGLKTLAELDVKPGDVVKYDGGNKYTIMKGNMLKACDSEISFPIDYSDSWNDTPWFTLVSRAPDTPKTWGEMTPEEKGALLLAAHEGKVIELNDGYTWHTCSTPAFAMGIAYRVKPEPKREEEFMYYGRVKSNGTCPPYSHRITFDLIDGEPDCASIKMERIK